MGKLSVFKMKNLYTDFTDRFNYLYLGDNDRESPRDINQELYKSRQWLDTREKIILRDNGGELGIATFPILGSIIVHHINPVKRENILNWDEDVLFDPDNLICCSYATHNQIHYGRKRNIVYEERSPGDTTLW